MERVVNLKISDPPILPTSLGKNLNLLLFWKVIDKIYFNHNNIQESSQQVGSKRRRDADGNQNELIQAKRQMTESTYIYQQQQHQQQSALFSNVQQGERFQVHRIHFTGEHMQYNLL